MAVHCDTWLNQDYKQMKLWIELKFEIVLTSKQKKFYPAKFHFGTVNFHKFEKLKFIQR